MSVAVPGCDEKYDAGGGQCLSPRHPRLGSQKTFTQGWGRAVIR